MSVGDSTGAGEVGDSTGAGEVGDSTGAGEVGDSTGAGEVGDSTGAGEVGDSTGAGEVGDSTGAGEVDESTGGGGFGAGGGGPAGVVCPGVVCAGGVGDGECDFDGVGEGFGVFVNAGPMNGILTSGSFRFVVFADGFVEGRALVDLPAGRDDECPAVPRAEAVDPVIVSDGIGAGDGFPKLNCGKAPSL